MLQMVESTIEREPVEVLRSSLAGLLVVKPVDPPRQRLVRGDASKSRLPEMAVRGDKPRQNPMSSGIPCLRSLEACRRLALTDGGDLSAGVYDEIPGKHIPLARRHGEQLCIANDQLDWPLLQWNLRIDGKR